MMLETDEKGGRKENRESERDEEVEDKLRNGRKGPGVVFTLMLSPSLLHLFSPSHSFPSFSNLSRWGRLKNGPYFCIMLEFERERAM